MTQAPVAVVAALREVSVLFAAAIGALVLKEGFGWKRMVGRGDRGGGGGRAQAVRAKGGDGR